MTYKKILLSCLLSSTIVSSAVEIPTTYYVAGNSNVVENVVTFKHNVITNGLTAGKTYRHDDAIINFNITAGNLELIHPNFIYVKLYNNSKYCIYPSFVEFNTNQQPSLLSVDKSVYTFSLESGTMDIINNNTNYMNNVVQIQLPALTDSHSSKTLHPTIVLKQGCFRIRVKEQKFETFVYSGDLLIKNTIKGNNFIVSGGNKASITLYEPPVEDTAVRPKLDANVDNINDEGIQSLKSIYLKLNEILNNVIFVSINSDVYGIKLH